MEEAVSVQRAAAKAGFRKRLGDILVKKGYLTPDQVKRILSGQTADTKTNRIGDYDIVSKLGEGGMGAVYKARQRGIERTVALKILSSNLAKDAEFRERFIREARAVARLNHPNIVAGIDVGSDRGVYFFAMEYVEGESLGGRLHRNGGKLPEKEALEFTRQVALALHHAHTHGLLHRDVKPENILIDKEGQAKLADLGLARSARVDEDANLTTAGMAVGTPYYISPEQARGKSDLTPGTDLYSLGATLYHLLTGKHVFEGPTGAVIMAKHVAEAPPDPRDEAPELSKATAQIVTRLLQKDPKDRYKDGQTLADELKAAAEKASSSRQPAGKAAPAKGPGRDTPPAMDEISQTSFRAPRLTRRRRETDVTGGLVAALGLVAGLAILLVVLNGGGSRTSTQRPRPAPPPPADYETPARPAPTQPAKAPAKTEEKTPDPKAPAPSDDPVGLQPNPDAIDVTTANPSEAPRPRVKEPRKVAEDPQALADALFEGLATHLKAERFQDAVKAIEQYRKANGEAETAALAETAVALVRQVSQILATARETLDGKQVQVGDQSGVASRVTETGFDLAVGKGVSMSFKWADVPAAARLGIAGIQAKNDNHAERGFYLFYQGDLAGGAVLLREAHTHGQIGLTRAWRRMLDSVSPEKTEAKPEPKAEPKADPQAAAKTEEAPKDAPKTPVIKFEKPKTAAQLFKGKVLSLSATPGHVDIGYDFTDPEQAKDFTADPGDKWEIKDGALRMTGGGRNYQLFVNKGRFLGGQNFRIVAKMTFEEVNDQAGLALRDRGDAGNGRFISLSLGGSGAGGGNFNNNNGPNNRGIGIRMSENSGNSNIRYNWSYDTGKDYVFSLTREGDKWSAREGTWEIDNRKRKDIPEEWSGHGTIYSRGTKIKITELHIQGVLDPEWVKQALAELEK
ncbi:MAG: protein kinase [Planctomycetota bacterium]|nr:protein kinase [Planctomycetota bacterium]